MKINKRKSLATALLALLIALGQQLGWFEASKLVSAPVAPGYYKVLKVFDGDTIAVDMNGKEEKVRMIGIDTPETHDPRKAVECFGHAASDFTTSLIGISNVRLEADPTNQNRDRYDRLLRYVYLPDGRLVNLEIIASGYGFAYTSFPFTKIQLFREAEKQAREMNRGLWSSCPVNIDSKGFIHSGTPPQ